MASIIDETIYDGTVYTQSGDIKRYERGIFSYETNVPNHGGIKLKKVSDDGTYMGYQLYVPRLNFRGVTYTTSYYLTTKYGDASKTFYYDFIESTPIPDKYYLHITGKCVSVTSTGFGSDKYTGVVVSLSLNNNSTSSDGISLGSSFTLNSSLSLSCSARGSETKNSSVLFVRNANIYLPANTDLSTYDNRKYLYAIGIRPDEDFTYPIYSNFYSSNITWYNSNPTSVTITLDNGDIVTAAIVYHKSIFN